MTAYWLKFKDGSEGYCEGKSAYDAVKIAEHLTGKIVDVEKENKFNPENGETVKCLPYPTSNMIWQFEHPVHGKTPNFCYGGKECHGKRSCPKSPCCTS